MARIQKTTIERRQRQLKWRFEAKGYEVLMGPEVFMLVDRKKGVRSPFMPWDHHGAIPVNIPQIDF